jgi:hypothetical protein
LSSSLHCSRSWPRCRIIKSQFVGTRQNNERMSAVYKYC